MKKIVLSIIIFSLFLVFFSCTSDKSPTSPPTNLPPILQSFKEAAKCQKGQSYTYEAKGYDPDGKQVSYHFAYWSGPAAEYFYKDLGWTSFANNYETYKINITWASAGDFILCCFCKDKQGNESNHDQIDINVNE